MFSSSWAELNDIEKPSSFDGASAQQVIDILYPPDGGEIRGAAITEGKFKGIQLAKMGYVVLSINGVNCWQMILSQFVSLVKRLQLDAVHIYFDADMEEKLGVAEAATELFKAISANDLDVYFVLWPKVLGKGIDDMLLSGHREKLRMKRGASYIKKLEPFIEEERRKQREYAKQMQQQRVISSKAFAYNTSKPTEDKLN